MGAKPWVGAQNPGRRMGILIQHRRHPADIGFVASCVSRVPTAVPWRSFALA